MQVLKRLKDPHISMCKPIRILCEPAPPSLSESDQTGPTKLGCKSRRGVKYPHRYLGEISAQWTMLWRSKRADIKLNCFCMWEVELKHKAPETDSFIWNSESVQPNLPVHSRLWARANCNKSPFVCVFNTIDSKPDPYGRMLLYLKMIPSSGRLISTYRKRSK